MIQDGAGSERPIAMRELVRVRKVVASRLRAWRMWRQIAGGAELTIAYGRGLLTIRASALRYGLDIRR